MWSICLAFCLAADAKSPTTSEVNVPGVVLTLIDQADVPAREAGVLMKLAVREGQFVEEGQLLGQIDDRDARLRQEKARTELAQATQAAENDIKVRFARKSADVAQSELQRSLDAVSKFNRSVSQTEIDRLQLLADKSQLEIEQATIDFTAAGQLRELKLRDVELAELNVENRKITAPLTGMVVQWRRHAGEWVEPGTPVVRMIRLNQLRAEGFALGDELTPASVGAKVRLLVDLPGRPQSPFVGELVFVSPEIDPVNGQVRFWAEIDNPKQELRPGQMGTLQIAPTRPAE